MSVCSTVVLASAIAVAVSVWWAFFSKVRASLRFNPSSVIISAVLQKCKTLSSAWRPIPWLPGGNAQTLAVAKLRPRPRVTFERELFALSDGGQVGLDWLQPAVADDAAPVLVALHGINGSSGENYLRHFLLHARHELGCRCVVMVARGLGGVPLKTWRPYTGGYTGDIREVVAALRVRYPAAPILVAGFSLGANVLTRYLGQEGEKSGVAAAVAVSSPYCLSASSRHLETSGRMGKMYSAQMASGLARFAKKNLATLVTGPGNPDYDAALRARLCRDYDDSVTCKIFGYASAEEFYLDNSSLGLISAVKTPLLLLGAVDDPMIGCALIERAAKEAEKSSHVVLAASPAGGHLGFLEVRPGKVMQTLFKATDSWADRAAVDFLRVAMQKPCP